MKKKLASLLAAAALGACGWPAWAQTPIASAVALPSACGAPNAAACDAPACPVNDCGDGQGGYFTAGAGLYFMTPFYSSNSAGFYTATTKGLTANVDQQNFSQHINAAPLIWLGYTFENGFGARARWFEFAGSQNAQATGNATNATISNIFPLEILSPGETLASSRSLDLNVIDLEATNNFVWGRWAVLASVGLRYAHISSSFSSNYNGEVAAATATSSYYANATFNGVGPTISLEGRRRVGDSDFYLYGSGRASLLFGALHQNASLTISGVGVAPRVTPAIGELGDPTLNAASDESTLIGVGELELGGEWAKVVGRVRVFAQLAFVGQMWVGGSSSPNGSSVLEAPLSFIGLGGFGQTTNNFGFMGGVFRAGVSF